ncbi:DMT family transporter [Pseudarthrobacter sulfonivorans]|uniref:DMT family transporter n=1 Tax=Pseudarthrobacter sulfonivorans TaxID=121292 RepID=UPI0027838D80|nr:DMT family transporter [Pseudarthrobacter sulfonivorans]MDP9998448.1 transporter family-2 protein [Pseudarthrobacter sulfonivorans]
MVGRRTALIILSLAVGTLLAAQARINSFLAAEMGDGFAAALVVFSLGFTTTAALTLVHPTARAAVRLFLGQLRRGEIGWWICLAGPMAIVAVLAQAATVKVIGLALFSLFFIFGQMVSSASIDHFGWAMGRRLRLTPIGLAAVVLALAGVVAASLPRLGNSWASTSLVFVFVFAAGLLMSWQMALSGSVTAATGRPEPAGLATYVFGITALLMVITVMLLAGSGTGVLHGLAQVKWWYVAAGILGPVVVLLGAVIIRTVGALLFSMGLVAGQLAGSMLLDVAWPSAGTFFSWATPVGGAMALVAMIVLQLWGHHPELAATGPDKG